METSTNLSKETVSGLWVSKVEDIVTMHELSQLLEIRDSLELLEPGRFSSGSPISQSESPDKSHKDRSP